MKIFNSMSGRKEEFVPLVDGNVSMYVCGPTVYDHGHLGHGRSAVNFDVIRKYLIYKGYKLKFVTNYTDIDDKMINRAEIMKITVRELAEKIIPEYGKDYEALGVAAGDVQPRATEYIDKIISIIKRLEEKGCTYVISDGVYFDIGNFPEYGKLSKQNLDELRSGARVEMKEEKKDPRDFVLWKFAKPGEPKWESPWGEGRPGWHIECSAMSWALLGESIDIHGGGADLMFPHHECEIAQSESAFGVPFVKYWMHNGFIRIDNEKMSKSLNNFFTLKDIFAEYDPKAVRLLFLQTHYRSPIDFTKQLLTQAESSLRRIHDARNRLKRFIDKKNDAKMEDDDSGSGFVSEAKAAFIEAMDDDFETPRALAACFDLLKEINRRMDGDNLNAEAARAADELLIDIDRVLGIFKINEERIDDEVKILIEEREKARKNKNFAESDRIRDVLKEKGIVLEDTDKGTVWKKM